MRSVVFLFLTFIVSQLLAQDLIVKTTGDSLNCLITRNENSYMYFNQIVNHRFKRDSLAMADIKTFKVDYYTTKKTGLKEEVKTVSAPKPVTIQPYIVKKTPTQNDVYRPRYTKENYFFLSIGAGLSNRTVTIPSGLSQYGKDFFEDLLQGGVLGIEAAYFINDNIGFGFQANQHISNVIIKDVSVLVDSINNIRVVGDYELKIRINYFGPTFYARKISNNEKHIFIGKGSLGYTHYSEKEYFSGNILTATTGGNLSLAIGGEYYFMLDPHIAIGAGVNYHQAQIISYTTSDGVNLVTTSNSPIDANRYDLKVLLAYWF